MTFSDVDSTRYLTGSAAKRRRGLAGFHAWYLTRQLGRNKNACVEDSSCNKHSEPLLVRVPT